MNTTENNKIIDKFLNRTVSANQYNENWNELMQLVEKIESLPSRMLQGTLYLGNEVKIYKVINTNTHYCEIHLVKEFGHRIISIQFSKKSKIEAVCNACLEFIKWYNEQK